MATESLSSLISTAMNWIAPIFMLILALVVITMISKRNWTGALTIGAVGVLTGIFVLAAPALFEGIGLTDPKKTAVPVASEAPEPVATTDPVVNAEPPADLTGLWTTLMVIGGILVLGILAVVLFSVAKGARHASLELQEKQAAAAAEKAKALAVWAKSTERHGELKDKVIEIETDWDLLFSYPTLVDASVPQTAAFHRALKAADAASDQPPADLSLSMDIGALPYPKLVAQADAAWERAWSFAQRTGLKLIPGAERKKVDQIVRLLNLARDGGGSEHERSVAYERAAKLIGELQFVKIPAGAIEALGSEARLMIEAPAEVQAEASRRTEKVAITL